MSGQLHRSNNGKQNVELLDSLQRAAMERLDGIAKHMREKSNQPNEHEQSGQSCESFKCDCDPGTNATCTCTRATSGTTTDRSTAAAGHTSFPCAHCRDHDSTAAGLVRKHKYTSITTRECSSAADYIERDYADYIAATSASGENTRSGIRVSDESRNFKQADADSADSVERRTGIPAGVTI